MSGLENAMKKYEEITQKIEKMMDDAALLKSIEVRSTDEQTQLELLNERVAFEREKFALYSKVISEIANVESKNSQTFLTVDKEFVVKVTGIDAGGDFIPRWNIEAELLATVQPSPLFAEIFKQNSATFHMRTEAGRRTVLDLFLRDVLSREEFRRGLRIFPGLEFEVKSVSESEPLKLSGVADYTIGHHTSKGIFELDPGKELHLVAVEAKRDWAEDAYWKCVAQVAALYKSRKDAGKEKCRVWGIISNATHWKFLSINDRGVLSESREYVLELNTYCAETEVIYRIIHRIVTLCFNTSPPSNPVENAGQRLRGPSGTGGSGQGSACLSN
jgi:hypothetical protein